MDKEQLATFWQRAIEEQEKSGMKVSLYCAREGLKKGRFYYWRRKLRASMSPGDKGYPVCRGAFLEISPIRDVGSGVRVIIGERLRVELEKGFDPVTLRAAVDCLMGDGLCWR